MIVDQIRIDAFIIDKLMDSPLGEKLDAAITEILITTDEGRRQELYTYVLNHLHEDAVYIPLTYECNKAIYRSDMKGFHFTQTQYEVPFQDFSF